MNDIKVGSVWVSKSNNIKITRVGGLTVSYCYLDTPDRVYDSSISVLFDFFEPKVAEPTIAVGSVWRSKEDGELVYIESNDPSYLPYNINFSPLGDADLYANDTKGFLGQYEFVCDSKYDVPVAFNAPSVAPDIANETLKPTSAVDLLETSAATLIRCGKKYDSTGNNSERVMDRIVDMFNAATGHELSEAQGNIFMVCLKVVRSETSTYHDDDHYIDGVNYFAMAGEASSKHYKDSE